MNELDNNRPICLANTQPHNTDTHAPVNMQPECNGVIVRLSDDRLIVVDLWQCPTCEARVIDRLGMGKMVERFEGETFDHLERRLNALGPNVQVGYPERNEVYGYSE